MDSYLDLPDNWGRNNIGKLNGLKAKNPQLKTILAVGGWNEGSAKYSAMAASPQLRSNFVKSATETVLKYGFNGFDVDWEYPNARDSVNGRTDIDNFTQVLKELKESFSKYGLMLTAAVGAAPSAAANYYDIAGISKYLDYVGLMAYDFNGAWDTSTGHNAPLYRGTGDENISDNMLLTVDASVRYWLDHGCPPEKLLVGMPFYGRTFTLANAAVTSVRAPASGAGPAGPITSQSGMLGYNEICAKFKAEKWDMHYDPLAKVPYAVQGSNWLSYDDPDSIQTKIDYGKQFGIGGVIVWSIETDDFRGLCNGEDYPLLRSINKALRGNSIKTTTTASATTTTTTAKPMSTTDEPVKEEEPVKSTTKVAISTTTAAPVSTTKAPSTFVCEKEGQVPNPLDCASFFVCTSDENRKLHATKFLCPDDLYYDHKYEVCNY